MSPAPHPLPKLDVLSLITDTDASLVALLEGLTESQWRLAAVKVWNVKQVVAHLLDGNLRRLSLDRDGWMPLDRPRDGRASTLVEFLNRWNAEWVRAADRLSPLVLVALLTWTNREVERYLASLDPDAPARFPVTWAGPGEAPTWLDIAREYTEKWHHQQQIRDAVGQPGLLDAKYLGPLLSAFARALPVAYAATPAEPGTRVIVGMADLSTSRFLLVREADGWGLYDGTGHDDAVAEVQVPAEMAWRLFTKGVHPSRARAAAECAGPAELTDPFFATIGIVG